ADEDDVAHGGSVSIMIVTICTFARDPAMHLEGSCHCGAVRFSVEAMSPVPFLHCHCSICRKTAGSGGYAVNLGADMATLKVRGKSHLRVYHAVLREDGRRAT